MITIDQKPSARSVSQPYVGTTARAVGVAFMLAFIGCRDHPRASPSPAADSSVIGSQQLPPEPPAPARKPVDCSEYAAGRGRFEFHWCQPEQPELWPLPCPDERPCLFRTRSSVLASPGWDHFWYIAVGAEPGSDQLGQMDELQQVLALEGIREIVVSCTMMQFAPRLFGIEQAWIDVSIVPDPTSASVKALSPDQADRQVLQRERGTRDEASARMDHRPLFTTAETARMKADTFITPTLRVVEAGAPDFWGETKDRLRIFAAFSPESARVYLWDRSYKTEAGAMNRGEPLTGFNAYELLVDFDRGQGPPLTPWLRALGVEAVRFPLDRACDIPDELGGKRWYEVDISRVQ